MVASFGNETEVAKAILVEFNVFGAYGTNETGGQILSNGRTH